MDPDKTGDPSARSSSSIADIKEIKIATPVAKMNVDSDVETKVVVTEATKDNTRNDSLSSEGSLERKRSAGLPDMWSFNLEGQDLDSVSDILSTEDASSIRKESLLDKLFGNAAPTTIDDFALPSDLSKNEVSTFCVTFLMLYLLGFLVREYFGFVFSFRPIILFLGWRHVEMHSFVFVVKYNVSF